MVVAALLIMFGGALSAAVSYVIRKAPDRPGIVPAVESTPTKNPSRRPHVKPTQPEVPASAVPPLPSETPTIALLVSPAAKQEPAIAPAPQLLIRSPRPSRSLAYRDMRTVPRSDPGTPSPEPAFVMPAREPAFVVPPPPAPSELARESRLLASAIAKLRQDGDAEAALRLLDEHRTAFAMGVLRAEATATRIEALLRLGRNPQALVLLEAQPLSATGVGREMLVARAELRADRGRYSVALADFDRLLSAEAKTDTVAERALYGRAVCRTKGGDWEGARRDFENYLADFPRGRFIDRVRAALAHEHR